MASTIILSDNGASSGSAGLKTTGGNDGTMLLQTTTSGGTPTTAISISNTQVVTYTNQPTYTGGTANGVLYLNGSKAVTSGTALVFDGSNLGIGVTPSAWVSGSKAFQLGAYTALSEATGGDSNLTDNSYLSAVGTYRSIVTAAASRYQLDFGVHKWLSAASVTAGSVQTFNVGMTLDASGNLGVGVTTVGQKLEIGSSGTVYAKISSSTNSSFRGVQFGINGDSNIYGAVAMEVNGGELRTTAGYSGYGGYQTFYTNGSERARIDSSGRFAVGTTNFVGGGFSPTMVVKAASDSLGGGLLVEASNTDAVLVSGYDGTSMFLSSSYRSNAGYKPLSFYTSSAERARITTGGNFLQLAGRRSNAYTLGNQQMWVYASGGVANGGTIALCAINQIYDNLCYELDIFVNRGGYFAAKYAGVFGYNGFTKAITTGDTGAAGLTMTGTTYNETMTITNSSGVTVNQYIFCLRVWGLGTAGSVSTGGADLVTSSYLTRIE